MHEHILVANILIVSLINRTRSTVQQGQQTGKTHCCSTFKLCNIISQ